MKHEEIIFRIFQSALCPVVYFDQYQTVSIILKAGTYQADGLSLVSVCDRQFFLFLTF